MSDGIIRGGIRVAAAIAVAAWATQLVGFMCEALRARRLRRLRRGLLPGGRTRPSFSHRLTTLSGQGLPRGRRWVENGDPAYLDRYDLYVRSLRLRESARRLIRIQARARKQRRGWA